LVDALRAEIEIARAAASGPRGAPTVGAIVGGAGRGRRAPAHRLIARLYAGELSSVYLAEPIGGGPRVAYKVLRQVPDAGGGNLFDRSVGEYEVLARLRHPNVVRITRSASPTITLTSRWSISTPAASPSAWAARSRPTSRSSTCARSAPRSTRSTRPGSCIGT